MDFRGAFGYLRQKILPSEDILPALATALRKEHPMEGMRIISADTHVVEPDGLWVERLAARFAEKAPRVVPHNGQPCLVAPGIEPFPLGGVTSHGQTGTDLEQHMGKGYEGARPSG
jgi:hypothetical protein